MSNSARFPISQNTLQTSQQGKDNFADTLSRATIDGVQLGINYANMAAAQQQDDEVQLTAPPR